MGHIIARWTQTVNTCRPSVVGTGSAGVSQLPYLPRPGRLVMWLLCSEWIRIPNVRVCRVCGLGPMCIGCAFDHIADHNDVEYVRSFDTKRPHNNRKGGQQPLKATGPRRSEHGAQQMQIFVKTLTGKQLLSTSMPVRRLTALKLEVTRRRVNHQTSNN